MTAGHRLAEAGNHLIQGIQEIQKIVTAPEPYAEQAEVAYDHLSQEREKIAAICERLVGPYKILVVDMDR